VKRRDFIRLLGGAAAGWPLAARAQQAGLPIVGVLDAAATDALWRAGFVKGLGEMGFVEGRNILFDFRSAQGDFERLPELAADLVRRRVAVLATLGGPLPVRAVRVAGATMPIVFEVGGDPGAAGLVASLNRPGGNVTGVSILSPDIEPKRLGLLHQLLPKAARFAVLTNPAGAASQAAADTRISELQAAAASFNAQIEAFPIGSIGAIDSAFAALAQKRVDAVLVTTSPLFAGRVAQLVTLSARYMMPAIFFERRFALAGGLMSYGPSYPEQVRQVGIYVGRILKGEKAADLPVMQPTKFELVLNVQAAKVLGVELPPTLLAIADEVIE
jgi:putative ABC transport system substrate-binding protein